MLTLMNDDFCDEQDLLKLKVEVTY